MHPFLIASLAIAAVGIVAVVAITFYDDAKWCRRQK